MENSNNNNNNPASQHAESPNKKTESAPSASTVELQMPIPPPLISLDAIAHNLWPHPTPPKIWPTWNSENSTKSQRKYIRPMAEKLRDKEKTSMLQASIPERATPSKTGMLQTPINTPAHEPVYQALQEPVAGPSHQEPVPGPSHHLPPFHSNFMDPFRAPQTHEMASTVMSSHFGQSIPSARSSLATGKVPDSFRRTYKKPAGQSQQQKRRSLKDDDQEEEEEINPLEILDFTPAKFQCQFCRILSVQPRLKGHMCCEGVQMLQETFKFATERPHLIRYLKRANFLHVGLRSLNEQREFLNFMSHLTYFNFCS